jgi:uncharacterized protein YecT (DUF1311 family)
MKFAIFSSLILTLILVWGSANARQRLEGNVSLSLPMQEQHSLQSAESELNTVYQKLLGSLEGQGSQKLTLAQQNWKKYSLAECDYIANYSPAELLHPRSYTECLISFTNERASELKNQLYWLELLEPGISNPL